MPPGARRAAASGKGGYGGRMAEQIRATIEDLGDDGEDHSQSRGLPSMGAYVASVGGTTTSTHMPLGEADREMVRRWRRLGELAQASPYNIKPPPKPANPELERWQPPAQPGSAVPSETLQMCIPTGSHASYYPHELVQKPAKRARTGGGAAGMLSDNNSPSFGPADEDANAKPKPIKLDGDEVGSGAESEVEEELEADDYARGYGDDDDDDAEGDGGEEGGAY